MKCTKTSAKHNITYVRLKAKNSLQHYRFSRGWLFINAVLHSPFINVSTFSIRGRLWPLQIPDGLYHLLSRPLMNLCPLWPTWVQGSCNAAERRPCAFSTRGQKDTAREGWAWLLKEWDKVTRTQWTIVVLRYTVIKQRMGRVSRNCSPCVLCCDLSLIFECEASMQVLVYYIQHSSKNVNYPMIYSPSSHPRCTWLSSFRQIWVLFKNLLALPSFINGSEWWSIFWSQKSASIIIKSWDVTVHKHDGSVHTSVLRSRVGIGTAKGKN